MSKYIRITLSGVAAAALVGLTVAAHAQQDYPNRPIRFITPYAPGGSTTFMARLIGQHYTERWGQNVIVDNRPGGNTIIGTETLANSPPDGYTIMLATSTLSILSSLTKTPYDPIKDFAPVASLGYAPQVLVLFPGVPANTVQEVIALAKAKPNSLNFGSSGAGGPTHLSGELFNLIAGVKTQHIPYKGAGPAITDLIGGQIQMYFATPVSVMQHIENGRIKALAITGNNRSPVLPQVPTFAEAGMPAFEVRNWQGLLAPAGTPRAIVDRLSRDIGDILRQPDVVASLRRQGLEPLVLGPQGFAALMRADMARFAKVIESANIKMDH
jgi:tripartite-type tricarboxylate transporter receptor subunit TctC